MDYNKLGFAIAVMFPLWVLLTLLFLKDIWKVRVQVILLAIYSVVVFYMDYRHKNFMDSMLKKQRKETDKFFKRLLKRIRGDSN